MSTSTPRLRAATQADLPALVDIENQCFDSPWPAKSLEVIVERRDAWVATDSSRSVISSALFQRVLDEAELLRLAVLPQNRRKGYGRALLMHSLQVLLERQVSKCYLEVRDDNFGALSLYYEEGFEFAGKRRSYYSDGADAVLLCRRLEHA